MSQKAFLMAEEFMHQVNKRFCYLAERWQDEKEYEDFNDYIVVIRSLCDQFGVVHVNTTKSPFGFIFAIEGTKFYQYIKGNKIVLQMMRG